MSLNTHLYDDFALTSDESFSVVQCLPLASLLTAMNVTVVDYLSLDVQGVEKQVRARLTICDLFEILISHTPRPLRVRGFITFIWTLIIHQ